MERLTKKQICNAGDILRSLQQSEEYENARNILSAWRTAHIQPLTSLNMFLRSRLNSQKYGSYLIGQRLKRLPSIVDKLNRFPQMNLHRMQDIAGIRVIVNNVAMVNNLYDNLVESHPNREIVNTKNYIETPKADGYRSIHIVWKCPCEGDFAELPVELQIRTQLQHLWGTAVETLGMLTNSSIKTGKGSQEQETYFRIVSALFAMQENTPVPSEYVGMSKDELIHKLKEIDNTIGATQKLTATATAVADIVHCKKADYYLISLDVQQGKTTVMPFTHKQLIDAERFYSLLEKNTMVNTVLVSAGDVKHLHRAYPNFFLDTKEFVGIVERYKKKQ